MEPSLPQNDPNPQRAAALASQRENYNWSYYPDQAGLPMVEKVPRADQSFTKPAWTRDAITVILRILANQALQDIGKRGSARRLRLYIRLARLLNNPEKAQGLTWLLRKLLPLIRFVLKLVNQPPQSENIEDDLQQGNTEFIEARAKSMLKQLQEKPSSQKLTATKEDKKTFQAYQELFQIIYLPCISHHFREDRVFAAQRVAGPNPLVIAQIDVLPNNFPVTEAQYQAVMDAEDSLAAAGQEGRLYLADYAVLDNVKAGTFPEGQKYLYAPLALFAVPRGSGEYRSLVPVAIQCQQTPGPTNPIFTPPPPGNPQDEQWSWLMAKTIVQTADGNYHELISHLGRTHLLIEPFVIATQRQLAPNHPLGILLRPHFEGTLFINYNATTGLINREGTVDAVLGGTLAESIRLSVEGVRGYPFSFNDSMLPKTFASRGVDDPQKLPNYPYRDDGLLIWDAIHQWVSEYLGLYYHNDKDVLQDCELQKWLADLMAKNGGRMAGIGEKTSEQDTPSIHTLKYLIDATTLIIFTSSAQHAAVNFPQASMMTYGPSMPLAGYQPAPASATGSTEEDYFAMLPSLEQAETQMNMTYPLGSVYYTTLGKYNEYKEGNYFVDERVKKPLQKFQRRLKEIEVIIEDRNNVRPTFYDFLHPAKIPQSINI